MQKRGETQKGFVVALLLVLVAVVGVSYLSSSGSTGKAIGISEEAQVEDPDYRGLCGKCSGYVCQAASPGSPCVAIGYIGVCATAAPCDISDPKKGVQCGCYKRESTTY